MIMSKVNVCLACVCQVLDLASSCSLLHCVNLSMERQALHKDRAILLSSSSIRDYVLFAYRSDRISSDPGQDQTVAMSFGLCWVQPRLCIGWDAVLNVNKNKTQSPVLMTWVKPMVISFMQSCVCHSVEPRPILACDWLTFKMSLLYPVMILSPVTNEPVYLWNVPNVFLEHYTIFSVFNCTKASQPSNSQ